MRDRFKSAGRSRPAFLLSQWHLHPAMSIITFIVMTILIAHLALAQLLMLGLLLFVGLKCCEDHRFLMMMNRMRWLFVSIMLIYSFSIPGEYLPHWPFEFAPTYEGLQQGINQIVRISLVLAAIAILMATSTREVMMVGIYCCLRPLRFLNLSPERFTARLYLTLQYIDEAKSTGGISEEKSKWYQLLNDKINGDPAFLPHEFIAFDIPRLGPLDYCCMVFSFILLRLYL